MSNDAPIDLPSDYSLIADNARDEDGDLKGDYHTITASKGGGVPYNVRKCVRCNTSFSIPLCSNCDSKDFAFCKIATGGDGIVCKKCELGRSRWDCPTCGYDNPYSKSI